MFNELLSELVFSSIHPVNRERLRSPARDDISEGLGAMLQREKVFEHIDGHQSEHLRRIEELIRVPSISAEDRGIQQCAELLATYYRQLGCSRVDIVPTAGQPVVFAEYDAGKPVTLIVYFMYDVKQVSGENWTLIRDPFEPQVIDMPPFGRCLIGRGAVNQKGPLGAFLNAVESILATKQELPVNLKLVSDGEEEIGSPHLLDFANQHVSRLTGADAVIFPSATQNRKGVPTISLGCKGSAPFELECSGALWGRGPKRSDIHSSAAAIVDSPAWRLIHALATMTDPAHPDRVRVDGFCENVLPPTREELNHIDQIAERFDEASLKEGLGVDVFIDGVHGKEALTRYLFSPTMNIQGIAGGYIGPGFKTSTPHQVRVKLECRLVPNQTYTEILHKIRRHLEAHGYADVTIVAVRGGSPWTRHAVTNGHGHPYALRSSTPSFKVTDTTAMTRWCGRQVRVARRGTSSPSVPCRFRLSPWGWATEVGHTPPMSTSSLKATAW